MRVHHVSCATLHPLGGRLLNGHAALPCRCLVLELPSGLGLVDTGLGTHDLEPARRRLGLGFRIFDRPALDASETAVSRLRGLGLDPREVRHIVVTHLDVEHAGGLSDFPEAAVHVAAAEHAAALERRGFLERRRYSPGQWAHGPRWSIAPPGGERWRGFDGVRALPGLPPEVLLVPLSGHSRGHSGVAVDTGAGWLLHAGDAYMSRREVEGERRACPIGLDVFQRIMQTDRRARLANQERLRGLVREGGDVRVFCSHDPEEIAAPRAMT